MNVQLWRLPGTETASHPWLPRSEQFSIPFSASWFSSQIPFMLLPKPSSYDANVTQVLFPPKIPNDFSDNRSLHNLIPAFLFCIKPVGSPAQQLSSCSWQVTFWSQFALGPCPGRPLSPFWILDTWPHPLPSITHFSLAPLSSLVNQLSLLFQRILCLPLLRLPQKGG